MSKPILMCILIIFLCIIMLKAGYRIGSIYENSEWGQCVIDTLENKGKVSDVFLCRYGRAKWQQ